MDHLIEKLKRWEQKEMEKAMKKHIESNIKGEIELSPLLIIPLVVVIAIAPYL